MTGDPSSNEMRRALRRFDALLRADAREGEFQKLFAEFPYILSNTLPLGLVPTDIRPLGRPGKSEADFVLFPSSSTIKSYGVVEIKRPSSLVLVQQRRGVVTLSRDAAGAVAQGQRYRADLLSSPPVSSESFVLWGNPAVIFVVMGLRDQMGANLAADLAERQLEGLLPPGCHLIPYDMLRDAFSASVPPRLITLGPSSGDLELSALVEMIERKRFDWSLSYLTPESVDFWQGVEAALPVQARRNPAAVRPSRWQISGSPTGELATESPNDQIFGWAVLDVIERLHEAAEAMSIPSLLGQHSSSLKAFVLQATGRGSALVSDEAQRLLIRMVWDCIRSRESYAFLQGAEEEAPARELAGQGLTQFNWYDSGETSFYVHPFARFYGGASN